MPEGSRSPVTGTMSLGWSWSHHDPVQGHGWQLGVLEWGQSAVTSTLSLWANEPTCRNVCCCEGGKTEVTVKIRFEHSADGAFKESISTQQNTWHGPTLASNKSCCLGWGLGISFFCFSESSQCCKDFVNLKSRRPKPVLLYFSYLFPEACWQNCYKRTLGQNYLNREL